MESLGIIPARAGSRPSVSGLWHGGEDHPRARGEQLPIDYEVWGRSGSSPRARGAAC